MVEDETFFAWLDGELPAGEAKRVEALVAADPSLSSLAREHRAMNAGLRAAFDGVAAQPVPEELQDWIPSPRVVDIAEAKARHAARNGPPLWAQMSALAATLAIGIFAGNLWSADRISPIAPSGGVLVASADLEDALSTRLASAHTSTGPRVGLTFRDKAGTICRTFEDGSAGGLACRDEGEWRVRALFQGESAQTTDYRMASGSDPRLMEVVDSAISGEPFDAAQEKAAMDNGWSS